MRRGGGDPAGKACSNILVNHTLEEVLYENMKAVGLPEYTEEEYAFASAI